jgi:hypothetical protein
VTTEADDRALQTFRAAQERQLAKIREVSEVDALIAFGALVQWIDQAARHFHASSNGEACWRAFLKRFFPERYRSESAIKLLYDGVRGKLSHEFGTRGVLLIEDEPDDHWTEQSDLRFIHLPTLLTECEVAWQKFSAAIDDDPVLRARVVARAPGIIQPVRIATIEGVKAASASATNVDLEAMGWGWPPPERK